MYGGIENAVHAAMARTQRGAEQVPAPILIGAEGAVASSWSCRCCAASDTA